MRNWRPLMRLAVIEAILAAVLVLTTPKAALACASCISCSGPGFHSVCIAGAAAGGQCGTLNIYCTWNCVWQDEYGGYVPESGSMHCSPPCSSPTCWNCCP